MSKARKKNHKENTKRAADFNQKLLDGDIETTRRLLRTCTGLDKDDCSLMEEKLEGVVTVLSALFDLNTIKTLDCKIVPDFIFDIMLYSSHIEECHELQSFVSEDGETYLYPYILKLDDGSSIRMLLIEEENEDEDEEDEGDEEDIGSLNEYELGDDADDADDK